MRLLLRLLELEQHLGFVVDDNNTTGMFQLVQSCMCLVMSTRKTQYANLQQKEVKLEHNACTIHGAKKNCQGDF